MIQELMIISKGGIALFYHNFLGKSKKQDNYQLIASFLEQIAHLTKFGLKDDLGVITMSHFFYSYFTHKKSNLLSIFKCEKSNYDNHNVKKSVKRSLDLVAKKLIDKFYSEFKEDLDVFDGNISKFYSFNKTIDKIFSSEHS